VRRFSLKAEWSVACSVEPSMCAYLGFRLKSRQEVAHRHRQWPTQTLPRSQ